MSHAPVALPATVRVFERGWLSSNNVFFDDGDTVSVIDTGYWLHAEQTAALIENAAGGRPLMRIVNTHLHSDHVGGNALLRERHPGATIAIPAAVAAAVDAWDVEALTYAPTGQHCPRFAYDALLHAGDQMRLGGLDWQVLAAPGHDPHMVMLWCADERVLISADALWQHGFGVIFPEIEGESGFAEQRAALELIERVRPRTVIPGHGAPFADVEAALARAHARLAALAADPARNARSVIKALIKFWLLQVRQSTLAAAVEHFAAARYFALVRERYFASAPLAALIERSARELVAIGAAQLTDDGRLLNVD
ncbi:MAG: MBL fold metallo-hydrolase [Burkholderiales bacterium]|jgi:glyoxylase-like metal-dependent hydrolase (beta-lactamase superfamily II)|nr:MBL fold metallo-hydrolase [Burkholderiales bacterium]